MKFIVSCRYDYTNPLELAKIIEFLKTFDTVIAGLELILDGETKDHIHARVEHNLNPMAWSRLLNKICPFLKGTKKGHHWLHKEGVDCCSREKHNPPHLPKKCRMYGSFCYVLKNGNCVLNKGYTTEVIEEWINVGSTIKKATKLLLYKKIIQYSKLKRLATMQDIIQALEDYYEEVRLVPMPQWKNNYLLNLMDQIVFTLHPKLRNANKIRLLQEARQRYL